MLVDDSVCRCLHGRPRRRRTSLTAPRTKCGRQPCVSLGCLANCRCGTSVGLYWCTCTHRYIQVSIMGCLNAVGVGIEHTYARACAAAYAVSHPVYTSLQRAGQTQNEGGGRRRDLGWLYLSKGTMKWKLARNGATPRRTAPFGHRDGANEFHGSDTPSNVGSGIHGGDVWPC